MYFRDQFDAFLKFGTLLLIPGSFTPEQGVSWIIRLLTMTIASAIFIYFPIILFFPCYPPVITSQFYDCGASGPSSITEFFQTLLIGGINITIVWQSLLDALVHAAYISFLGCVILTEYILVINRLTKNHFPYIENVTLKNKLLFLHFRGSEFRWILKKDLLLYKSILILEKDMNTNLKYTAIPGMVYGLWAIETLAFYGTVKSVPQFFSNVFLSSLFLLTFVSTSFAAVIGNTLAAKSYTESQVLLLKWKRNSRSKVRKREIKALYAARLRVGDNYFEQSTPLVAQDFIANQTVSLLLL